ncbi:MAG: triose-phosphate isomerase [Clostridiales Family XIII bacterium]|jgi:triosephosphate isomerase|nr:triose-phosphate isomerase [Clostridiales Family XIII bacterium]
MRKKFIAGNWKMYKTTAEALRFAEAFKALRADPGADGRDVAICAPFTQLAALKGALAGTGVLLGAQNAHFSDEGAYTGEISPAMLAEIGVDCVIVGHSERREYFGETDADTNRKLHKLLERGMVPILCVGESLEIRERGGQGQAVERQLAEGLKGLSPAQAGGMVIAYEPIWAIGTGRTATPEQAGEMCGFIRRAVAALCGVDAAEGVRVLYGGSVKPGNAAEIMGMPDIDGALVGGASLVPEDFARIVGF